MRCRFAVALSAMMVSAVAGQRPPTLSRMEAGTCPSCSVTVELVATIGKATDAELIGDYAQLTRLADGSFVVASVRVTVPLLHYDRNGKYVGTLGRLGDGPGEYRWPQSVVRARGDSISIMGQRRISTISTVTGSGRSETVAGSLGGFFHAVLNDGTLIVNVLAQRQPAFALLTERSEVKKQFGPEQPLIVLEHQNGRTIRDPEATWNFLAPSLRSGFWAASSFYDHHVQHLRGDGSVITDIRRHPAWFRPYTFADKDEKLVRLGELRTPRLPQTVGIGVDSAGYVVVVSRVADAHWQKDPNAPPPSPQYTNLPEEKLEPTGGIDRYVDAVLEIYSDKSGVFLGSWRSDSPFSATTQQGLLYTRDQDPDGVNSFRVYRLRVVGAK